MQADTIVIHCAPTLAGMKTAALFSAPFASAESLKEEIRSFNRMFRDKGIRWMILGYTLHRALIYVYRPKRLSRDLQQVCTAELLEEYGYDPLDPGMCLAKLAGKMRASREGNDFPHEIGCFLGYPPEDVRCFIRRDRPCLLQGLWQVYSDVETAKETFRRYRLCTACYLKHLQAGSTLYDLAVAEV